MIFREITGNLVKSTIMSMSYVNLNNKGKRIYAMLYAERPIHKLILLIEGNRCAQVINVIS